MFKPWPLQLPIPNYDSSLVDVVMELQYLRREKLLGSTPAPIFFQLKGIFHLLESLGSARIEGNRTTIAEAVEAKLGTSGEQTDTLHEIENLERALSFLEQAVAPGGGISKGLILELHKITVADLVREGDRTPGEFRNEDVRIRGSAHTPPPFMQVEPLMEELITFVNAPRDQKLDLLRVALAHHRFAWIHPFRNGNGRVVRLLTYGLLIERGFDVKTGRLINPSAVFCIDRERYYEMLGRADSGKESDQLVWCEYVLRGLLEELKKIDKLLDYNFLSQRILLRAIRYCREREWITKLEAAILEIAVQKKVFKVGDVRHLMERELPQERSRVLGRMKERQIIEPTEEGGRRYVLGLSKGVLIRGVIHALEQEGFISASLS